MLREVDRMPGLDNAPYFVARSAPDVTSRSHDIGKIGSQDTVHCQRLNGTVVDFDGIAFEPDKIQAFFYDASALGRRNYDASLREGVPRFSDLIVMLLEAPDDGNAQISVLH